MDWVLVDYKYLVDKDDYSILSIEYNNVIDNIYLESVNSFMKNLEESFQSEECVKRQISVDFPRIKCYVNKILFKKYEDFILEIKHTCLEKEAILLCTQSTMYPVIVKLFKLFNDEYNDIHLVDFVEKNPLIYKFSIFNEYITVKIKKKFKVVKIKNGDPIDLQKIQVNTNIKINKDKNINKNIFYSISGI
jgi:hypothetical protein